MVDMKAPLPIGPIAELAIACAVGASCALFISDIEFFKRIDEMLINCMSIIIGAAVAGISLTAAAPRSTRGSVSSAVKLGKALKTQIKFWLGYLRFGGLAVLTLVIAHGLNWKFIPIARPSFIPVWIPDTNAWLVFVSVTFVVLQILRVPHIISAVNSLIDVATTENVNEIRDRNAQVNSEAIKTIVDSEASKPLDITKYKIKPH